MSAMSISTSLGLRSMAVLSGVFWRHESFDRQAVALPFGKTLLQAARAVASGAQQGDGLVGEDTVWPPTIGDNFAISGDFVQSFGEFCDRNRAGAVDVPSVILGFRANVEQEHLIVAEPRLQFVGAQRL